VESACGTKHSVRAAASSLIAALVALAAVAGGSGANVKGTVIVDKQEGYQIAIPNTWRLIPRTKAEVEAVIAALKKKKETDLATFYAGIIASKSGLSGLTTYRLQAFDWPGSMESPVPIELSVGIVKTPRAYGPKDLASIGAVYANALAANKGAKVTVPKTVTLPAGKAELILGSIPIGNGVMNGVKLYLIPHGKRLYELSFQIEASQLATATLFASMANSLKFA
jgi:hypothetical protein